jgi:ABC-type branched-subunit amino acid transport system substrate-binding protein
MSRSRTVVALFGMCALTFALFIPAAAARTRAARGVNGNTIKVAGVGIAYNFEPDGSIGAQARFKRANDTNELKGLKIEYDGFSDDKGSPDTALTEIRRLVTQDQVFALVPDLSYVNPTAYLTQQHVPYFGWAIDSSYCSPKPTTKLYGFGFNGCLLPPNPKRTPDAGNTLYPYVVKKTGNKHPTLAIQAGDSDSGRTAAQTQGSAFKGDGFDVVTAKATYPVGSAVADNTPYVQALLTSANGKAPDTIVCLLTVECIGLYNQIKASGYTGTFMSSLYNPLLTKALNGAVARISQVPLESDTPGIAQLKKDVEAFKPGTTATSSTAAAYFAADFFVQALKKAGKNPTPEKVQQIASTMTWKMAGAAGPTKYPASTVFSVPSCSSIVVSDGTNWNVGEPYACSTKTFPANLVSLG